MNIFAHFNKSQNQKQQQNEQIWIPIEQINKQQMQVSKQLLNAGTIVIKNENQGMIEEYCELYDDRLSCNKSSTDLFFKKYDDLENWFNIIRRFANQINFDKEYKLTKRLGYINQYTQIYQVKSVSNNQTYNVKIFNKNSKIETSQIYKEIQILRKLKHKNIINLLEVFDNTQNIYLIFDQYYGTEMIYKFEELLCCSEPMIARIIFKILEAINFIHQNGIIHGDIKMENIYVKSEKLDDICVANFSQSELIEQEQKSIKGSEGYQSPELYNSQKYDKSIDIYALGIIFYYLIYQVMPYSESQEYNDNSKGLIQFPQVRCSEYGMNLMQQMLQQEPSSRIQASQAIQHEWFLKMKVEEKLNRNKKSKEKSLPTILEKSDMFTMSPGVKQKNECIGVFEDEFLLDSLADRMQKLENQFKPSKQNHDQQQFQQQYFSQS